MQSWHITYTAVSILDVILRDILDGTNRYNFMSYSRYMDGE